MRLGFLLGNRGEGGQIKIISLIIPEQERHTSETIVSVEANVKVLYEIMSRQLGIIVGVAIYQPGFNLYLSATNGELVEELSKSVSCPMIALLCNEKSEHKFYFEGNEVFEEGNVVRRRNQ